MADHPVIESYKALLKVGGKGSKSDATLYLLRVVFGHCLEQLSKAERVALISDVPGKEYFAFSAGSKLSRAIRSGHFVDDSSAIEKFFDVVAARNFEGLEPEEITRACYTIAISFCAAIDLLKTGDQKRPGTYFEQFVAHLVGRRLNLNPGKSIPVLNLDEDSKLPTDLIFDTGTKEAKFHVPVKTSTRERIIQVWAHQKVLDGVYGTGRFKGLLVALAETKTDKKNLKVTEICLPLQWKVYQSFIAQMTRIYYMDIPDAYTKLGKEHPRITVKPFGEFFGEVETLAG